MFGIGDKKKKTVEVNGKTIELQDKPSILSKITGGSTPPQQAAPLPAKPTIPPYVPPTPPQAPAPATPAPSAPTAASFYAPPKTEAPASAPTPPAQPQPTVKPNTPYEFRFPGQQAGTPSQNSGTYTPRPAAAGPIIPTAKMGYGANPNAKGAKPSRIRLYIQGMVTKHPDLEPALRKEGIKESVYDFVKRMLMFSIIFAVVIGGVGIFVLDQLTHKLSTAVLLGVMVAFATFMTAFRSFLNFPTAKGKTASKKVERDILFAARDLIIALRSGMPLFNAITSVSSGYGETSREFLKIVEKVQLGTPLEDAIDQVVATSKSQSFRKIMLQASVSIRAGADVTSALQSVIDELAIERVIELRRYGQRLNAIAMFYMLFGIILPSMGIAVLTILTTFVPVFSVDFTLLEVVLIGLVFLQVVFLQMIRGSRPIFSM